MDLSPIFGFGACILAVIGTMLLLNWLHFGR